MQPPASEAIRRRIGQDHVPRRVRHGGPGFHGFRQGIAPVRQPGRDGRGVGQQGDARGPKAERKERGGGTGRVMNQRPEAEKLAAGTYGYRGKATTTAKCGEPGDYVLQATGNDYSGDGGGGFGCCWTTALVKIAVKP